MKQNLIRAQGGKAHIATGRMDTDLYGRRVRVAICGKLIRDTGDDPLGDVLPDDLESCNTCYLIACMAAKKETASGNH